MLARLAVPTANGCGWGLSFPYASRFVSVAAHTPNAYTTISAVAALTEAAAEGNGAALELAARGARFVLRDLGEVRGHPGWLRYWPGDDTRIVNVQALIAAAFAELSRATADPALERAARASADAALSTQRDDGSFPYAADERGRFVDAFHTGFVLEGLTRFEGRTDAVERGFSYFRGELVDADGFPRVAPGGPRATDGQNVAQLVQTLLTCGGPAERDEAWRLWESWSARANRPESLRWDIAPVVLAGARLIADTGRS